MSRMHIEDLIYWMYVCFLPFVFDQHYSVKTNDFWEKCVKLAWSLDFGIRFIPCKEGC